MSLTSGSAGSYTGRCHNSEKDRLMGWLILLVCGAIIMFDIAISTEESTPIPPQQTDDVDHTITFRNRSVGMCKMPELEHLEEQMN